MNITDNRIDLEKSFNKLKEEQLFASNFIDKIKAHRLEKAIKRHIKECTLPENVESADPNDLKDINI